MRATAAAPPFGPVMRLLTLPLFARFFVRLLRHCCAAAPENNALRDTVSLVGRRLKEAAQRAA